MCQACVQCSILAFYLRIGLARISSHHLRRTIYAVMGFSIVFNITATCIAIGFAIVKSLALQPKKYFVPFWFTSSAINLLLDLIIWSIPLPSVSSIMHNLSTRKKILLGLAFSVGMVCWCSVILRISLREYVLGMGSDPTYSAPIVSVLMVAEVSLAISCVSVATLRPLLVKMTTTFNRLREKQTPTSESGTTAYEFEASQAPAQSKGYGPRPGGPRATTLNKDRVWEQTIVGQELVEWKEDASDAKSTQFVQQTYICSCSEGDVELGGIVAHTSSCPRSYDSSSRGIQLQVPVPAATGHGTTHRSPSTSSRETLRTANIGSPCQSAHSQPPCDAIPFSESTVNLTNADTNTTIDQAS